MASILVCGAGAVGGFFGWKLSAVHPVSFLVRGAHGDRIQAAGLEIQSGGVAHRFFPATVRSPQEVHEPDLCILAVKFDAMPALLDTLADTGWNNTRYLSLLNGIEANPMTAARLGAGRTVYGFCQLGAERIAPGIVLHRGLGKVFLGSSGDGTGAVQSTARLFEAAGVETQVPDDFSRALWLKFVWNAVFNLLCAVSGQTTDRILTDPAWRSRADLLFDDLITAARAEGVDLRPEDRAAVIDGTLKWGAFVPSTLQDRRKGLPLETDAFSGALLRLAARHGLRLPAYEALDRELRTL